MARLTKVSHFCNIFVKKPSIIRKAAINWALPLHDFRYPIIMISPEGIEYIDIYCERSQYGFWDEPFNALTNLAFVVAAFFSFRLWKHEGGGKKDILALVIILFSIAIGSFLFHTIATRWSAIADLLPIMLFVFVSSAIFLHRIAGLTLRNAVIISLVFVGINIAARNLLPSILNGSVYYLPTFLGLVLFALWAKINRKKGGQEFAIASILLLISLVFRSIDSETCGMLPYNIGTHIFWHIFNGVLLYYIIRGLIKGSNK